MARPFIIQFWHGIPPAEVETLMDTWRLAANEGFEYARFDDRAASRFIEEHFDRRVHSAYLACAIPAMKADFFRICALLIHPGIYVDADMRRTGIGRRSIFLREQSKPLPTLYDQLARGLLFRRDLRIANGFIIVKRQQDPLLIALLLIVVQNIEKRQSNNVYAVTGPGVTTNLFNRVGAAHEYFADFELWTADRLSPFMRMVGKLPYKQTSDHWVIAQKMRSIYVETRDDDHG